MLSESWRQPCQRACDGVSVNVDISEVVGTAIFSARALVSDCIRLADVRVPASKIVLHRNPFIAALTLNTGTWTVFVLVLQPFSATKLYDSSAVTLDMGAVNTLVWHEVLPLDHFPAV